MANIYLAWQNRTDTASLSSGSWNALLPLANLQNRQVQKVARSADTALASTKFDVDLGAAYQISVLALIVHNISVSGKVRITASDTATFTALAYDSGWVSVWPAGVIPISLLEWEEDNFWLGTLSANARAGYQSPFINILPSTVTQRYWRVEINDTGNSDGYVQIGRLFMARGWRPGINYAYGASLGYEDPTPVDVSLSGAEFFDVRSKFRVFGFDIDYITDSDAYAYALELQRIAGVSGEVLMCQDTDDAARMPQRAFVGRLRQIGGVTQATPTSHSARFEIKELL